jgi:hypothetical protein
MSTYDPILLALVHRTFPRIAKLFSDGKHFYPDEDETFFREWNDSARVLGTLPKPADGGRAEDPGGVPAPQQDGPDLPAGTPPST